MAKDSDKVALIILGRKKPGASDSSQPVPKKKSGLDDQGHRALVDAIVASILKKQNKKEHDNG